MRKAVARVFRRSDQRPRRPPDDPLPELPTDKNDDSFPRFSEADIAMLDYIGGVVTRVGSSRSGGGTPTGSPQTAATTARSDPVVSARSGPPVLTARSEPITITRALCTSSSSRSSTWSDLPPSDDDDSGDPDAWHVSAPLDDLRVHGIFASPQQQRVALDSFERCRRIRLKALAAAAEAYDA